MISIESVTTKTLDMTELIKTFASLKTIKESFSPLEIQQMLKSVSFICCVDTAETCFYKNLLKQIDVFIYINIMC